MIAKSLLSRRRVGILCCVERKVELNRRNHDQDRNEAFPWKPPSSFPFCSASRSRVSCILEDNPSSPNCNLFVVTNGTKLFGRKESQRGINPDGSGLMDSGDFSSLFYPASKIFIIKDGGMKLFE